MAAPRQLLSLLDTLGNAASPYRNEPIGIGRNHTAPKFEVRVCPYRAVGTTRGDVLPTPTGAALTVAGVTKQTPTTVSQTRDHHTAGTRVPGQD